MSGFDGNRYRKDVLKPLLAQGDFEVSDPFTVLGLDPSVDDAALIRDRVGEVVAFWRKEQSSPRYKGLVAALLDQQDAISAELLDPGRRAAARSRVQGRSEEAEREALARVDELLDALERRHGAIPRDRLDRLRSLAAREGITEAQVDARLAHRTVVDADAGPRVEPIPVGQRTQVTTLLAELERLDPDHVTPRTLYDFLGLPAGAPAAEVSARRDAIDGRNRQRRHDRLRTVVDELLALTETLLVRGDPARYLAGVEADVRDVLGPAIETAVLLEDRVSAAESERLTREAVSAGLDPATARGLVVEVARSLQAPIDVGAVTDYVVCARCNATNAAGGGEECSRCGADLYRACPRCGRTSARSAIRCPGCALDLRAFDEAADGLEAAAADLDVGRLDAATTRVEAAAAWGDDLPDLVRLRERVATVGRTAADAWDNLLYSLDQRRVDGARRYLSSIERIASDRPGPDGTSVEVASTRVAALEAELADAVAGASGQEAALVALLDRFPDASAVGAALADVPVAPAADVEVEPAGDGLQVRWAASPAVGPVEYRVSRTIERTGGATTTLGRTPGTTFADASAPAGETVRYSVVAARLGVEATPALSEPVVPAPGVAGLEAVEQDGAVELRWRAQPVGDVWVDRTVVAGPEGLDRRMRGGTTGVLDTGVRPGTRYRYSVVVEYPSSGTSVVRSAAATVEAVAFALPDAPPAPTLTAGGRSLTLSLPDLGPGIEGVVLRAAAAPTVAPGTVVDEAGRRAIGGPLAGRDGTLFDAADGGPRWYVPVATVRRQGVVGPAVAHPGVAEVERLRVADGTDGPVLRWEWPTGCTEVVIHWSAAEAPVEPGRPGVVEARTTNTAYDIKGGWPVPPEARSFLVRSAARIDGRRVPIPAWSDRSTLGV